MQLYCPACKTAAHAAERCPRCGDRLIAPSELASVSRDQIADPPDLLKPTGFGRVVVGSVVALGLYLSLREMLLGLLAAGDLSDDAPGPLGNWAIRAGCVTAGAVLSGAGRPNGAPAGGVTGLLCGGLLLATDTLAGVRVVAPDGLIVVGIALVALAAGRIGGRVWPALVELPPSKVRSRGSSLIPLKDDQDAPRPVVFSWTRVGLGVALAVVGFLLADSARLALRSVAGQGLFLGSPNQVAVVDFCFAGVALAAGGVVAGAGTGAGLRHGSLMGVTTAAALAFLALVGKESAAIPLNGLLEVLGYAAESLRTPSALALVVGTVTVSGTLSGGFGGLLLPRLAIESRRKSYQD